MRHSPSAAAVALSLALVAVIAAPAAAAPFDPDTESIRIEPYTWRFASSPFGIAQAAYAAGGDVYGNAFDSSAFTIWSENAANESIAAPTTFHCEGADVDTTDPSGDAVLRCGAVSTALGLSVDGEARLYAAGDLVRTLFIVSNPTASPVSFSYSYSVDFYGGQVLRATPTTPALRPDVTVGATDAWVYNAEPTSLNTVVAWGAPDAAAPIEWAREWDTSTVLVVNDRDIDGKQIEVLPGAALAFAFFHKADPTGTAASRSEFGPASTAVDEPSALEQALVSSTDAIAASTAEFSTWSGRLSAGVPDGMTVANWQPLPVDDDLELAETGSDSAVVSVALGVAAVLFALGVLLIVWRRVRRTRSRV